MTTATVEDGSCARLANGSAVTARNATPVGLPRNAFRRLGNFLRGLRLDDAAYRYRNHNRRRWVGRRQSGKKKVVLVGLFDSKPSVVCNAYVTNALAAIHDARVSSYHLLGHADPDLVELYDSFGAHLELSAADLEQWKQEAKQIAEPILADLRDKRDVLLISIEGLLIGDLIYDSYLRYYNAPTLNLEDPRFPALVETAVQIYLACKDYLIRNEPAAFITDDFSYLNSGVMTRLMHKLKVPTYVVCIGDTLWILRVNPEHSGAGHGFPPPVVLPYPKYATIFPDLPAAERESGIQKGRQALERRLSGGTCPLVRMTASSYGNEGVNARILDKDVKPRVLVMMHDFVDSPHSYREMIFPDFWEWITFLLDRAVLTDFHWYVKPHPCLADPSRHAINEANRAIVDRLKKMYPTVSFLDPSASNTQIIKDGICAMYTVHGTSAHEFAYAGVPVVNCGDNPHISYDFNIHARSADEYAALIARSDRLKVKIDRAKIEEFVYMHYFHFPQRLALRTNPLGTTFFDRPDWFARLRSTTVFSHYLAETTDVQSEQVFDDLVGWLRDEAAGDNRGRTDAMPALKR
jgi:hypothetical protein